MLAVPIALRADEKKLGQLFPSKRKGQIGEHSQDWHENYRQNPKLPLSATKYLRVNAGDCARDNRQPDNRQTEPNLTIEFRGVKAEAAKNICHCAERGAKENFFTAQHFKSMQNGLAK